MFGLQDLYNRYTYLGTWVLCAKDSTSLTSVQKADGRSQLPIQYSIANIFYANLQFSEIAFMMSRNFSILQLTLATLPKSAKFCRSPLKSSWSGNWNITYTISWVLTDINFNLCIPKFYRRVCKFIPRWIPKVW